MMVGKTKLAHSHPLVMKIRARFGLEDVVLDHRRHRATVLRGIPWEGMAVARVPASGSLGTAMMQLRIARADGKAFFPVGTFQSRDERIATWKERTGAES